MVRFVVNGQDVNVTAVTDAGGAQTHYTLSASISWPASARVSYSPDYGPVIAQCIAEGIPYLEGWGNLNTDAKFAAAVAALAAYDVAYQRITLKGRITTPGGPITLNWSKAQKDGNVAVCRLAAGSELTVA